MVFLSPHRHWDEPYFPVVDAIFRACPQLLRCEYPRYVLTWCMLGEDEQAVELLRPWVEQMPGHDIVLAGNEDYHTEPWYDLGEYLSRWEARMGKRFRPVLRRDQPLPERATDPLKDETLRQLLEMCHIRGKAPAGCLSELAKDALRVVSCALLRELMEKGVLFGEEDSSALLAACEDLPDGREKQAVLLSCGCIKAVDYEL